MRILLAALSLIVLICSAAAAPAELEGTIDAHFASVNALGVNPVDGILYSAGKDGRVRIWDPDSLEMILEVQACLTGVNDIAVSNDGSLVATAGNDGFIQVWDALTAELELAFPAHDGPVNTVTFDVNDEFLYSGGEDGFVRSWEVEGEDDIFVLNWEAFSHVNGVNDLLVNSEAEFMFSGGADGSIAFFDTLAGRLENSVQAFENAEVLCLSFSKGESCLVAGGTNGEFRAWDAATGTQTCEVRAHAGNVNTIYSANGLVVTGGEDGHIRLWNDHGQMVGDFQAHVLGVKAFTVSDDTIFTGGADYKVRVWGSNF
ncbi:MAG: WD40 repeat domain-containing protein [bacterium]|nr:WD40 repeat domain-containing protein [bacterium]